MNDLIPIRTEDMPAEMRVLLNDYPRDVWEEHPGFKDKTRHWLAAHQMFRRIAFTLRSDTEQFLDRELEEADFARRLSLFGNRLIGNLHGHHAWEDMEFFPELRVNDHRFDAGLDILEKDHEALNQVLDTFARAGSRTIKLIDLDAEQARDEAGKLLDASKQIERFLDRHLGDEEELAVPIILHHRLRG